MVLTGTASTSAAAEVAGGRRGRPPGTSRRELELIALRLFTEQGFDNTTIEQIAAEAGVSKRTFFRYFSSKTSVLWSEFDHEVDVIRAALDEVPAGTPMMDAIRRAVVAANHYGPLATSPPSGRASPPTRSTRSPSAGPPWPPAARPTTAGPPAPTPT